MGKDVVDSCERKLHLKLLILYPSFSAGRNKALTAISAESLKKQYLMRLVYISDILFSTRVKVTAGR